MNIIPVQRGFVLPVFVKELVLHETPYQLSGTEDGGLVDIRYPTLPSRLRYVTVGATRFFEPRHRMFQRTHCCANQRTQEGI
ncbi:hypothetical protein METP3_03597 [Methanosarcinales archaeon]|nr:hypothetical protein METP3_03597 [Methanosarcinales archaeon]